MFFDLFYSSNSFSFNSGEASPCIKYSTSIFLEPFIFYIWSLCLNDDGFSLAISCMPLVIKIYEFLSQIPGIFRANYIS